MSILQASSFEASVANRRQALIYARRIYDSINRRSPEAGALGGWLAEHASSLGLNAQDASEEWDDPDTLRKKKLSQEDWKLINRLLPPASEESLPSTDSSAGLWMRAISSEIKIDPLSIAILRLALDYAANRLVGRLWERLCSCRGMHTHLSRDASLLALFLGCPAADVATRLAGDAPLLKGGLLAVDSYGALKVFARLEALVQKDQEPGLRCLDLLVGGAAQTGGLAWEAFAHLGRPAEVAAALLKAAIVEKQTGINILLYGPPGTGKTTFASALATKVGASLRAVGEADEDGDEPNRAHRLASLQFAQRLAHTGTSVLLFDEAEDLFAPSNSDDRERAAGSKVFIHRLLEGGPSPVIWTANDIGGFGPAVLRRMTMCLEVTIPNMAVRQKLWTKMAADQDIALADVEAARLARLVPAAPAVASNALRAARLAGGGAQTAALVVEGVVKAIGGGSIPLPEREPEKHFDIRLINADQDLQSLGVQFGSSESRRGLSLLVSGPPGTGKSAWIRDLAQQMRLPVLHKRASDLLSCYVGGTEENIAKAFSEARETQAFLVFDEADSFLMERSEATRSWEISQVNEMLTWMEDHELPFACTTNAFERLDKASLRRFLVKLRFGWMSPSQARQAFEAFFALPPPAGLEELDTLTPADFRLVKRRVDLGVTAHDPSVILSVLAAEASGRPNSRSTVGFRQPHCSKT